MHLLLLTTCWHIHCTHKCFQRLTSETAGSKVRPSTRHCYIQSVCSSQRPYSKPNCWTMSQNILTRVCDGVRPPWWAGDLQRPVRLWGRRAGRAGGWIHTEADHPPRYGTAGAHRRSPSKRQSRRVFVFHYIQPWMLDNMTFGVKSFLFWSLQSAPPGGLPKCHIASPYICIYISIPHATSGWTPSPNLNFVANISQTLPWRILQEQKERKTEYFLLVPTSQPDGHFVGRPCP